MFFRSIFCFILMNPLCGVCFIYGFTRVNENYLMYAGYVPDGLTEEEWKEIKSKKSQRKMKFDGTSGMKFRSRSFYEFNKGREEGKLQYNMPMENAKEKLKKGLIRPEDIPYMQRPGGMPDNSDLKKKFRFPWQK